jgi:hypothetical protein
MLDIDFRLDTRLQSFYEHIEGQSPPRSATSFEAPVGHRRRRTLNLIAAVAGVAVVAAGVGVFGAELAGHHGAKPPAPAGRPPDPFRLLPPASQITAGLPSVTHMVIHLTRGAGSALLPTFTPEGILFIVFSCSGSGAINVHSTNNLVGSSVPGCSGTGVVYGSTVPLNYTPAIHGKPLSLEITAGPSVTWEVAVADSGPVPPLPSLGATTRPAGAHVVVPMTYGVGTSSLETLFPTGPYYVQYACTGTGAVDISASDGSTNWVTQNCANGAVRTQVAAKPTSSGPINLTVEAAPRTLWEAVIYELPSPKS